MKVVINRPMGPENIIGEIGSFFTELRG